jgi:hypothetical protein
MKIKLLFPSVAAGIIVILAWSVPLSVYGQGNLTPSSGPAPVMKSLDQVEARIPISSAPYTITNPGAYYLTTNLTVTGGTAIDIGTNDVTLDLNGYTIFSTSSAPSGFGIQIGGGYSDLTIVNGHISGGATTNFNDGIAYNALPSNIRVANVSVTGCRFYGINIGTGTSSVIESCTAQLIGSVGLSASTVSHSSTYQCGSYGVEATVALDCVGNSPAGIGVYASSTATGCSGTSSSGTGVSAGIAIGCFGTSTTDTGLVATLANSSYGSTESIVNKYNMP